MGKNNNMKKLDPLNKYVGQNNTEQELDSATKELVKDYFLQEDIKNKWKQLLSNDHNVKTFDKLEDIPSFKEQIQVNTKSIESTSKKDLFGKLILGTFAILILAIMLISYIQKKDSEQTLAPMANIMDEYYSSPMQYRNTKGPITNKEKRQKAFDLYNNKEYKKASKIFEDINASQIFIEDDHFYLGLCYLYNKEPLKATKSFKLILSEKNLQRDDSASWFLALSLIESQNYEEAKIHLDKISQWTGNAGKMKKAAQAAEILELIK